MSATIRSIEEMDERRWRELWGGHSRFYKREPREAVTRHIFRCSGTFGR